MPINNLQPSIKIGSLIGSEYLKQFKALFNSNIHSFDWNQIASELSNFKNAVSRQSDAQNSVSLEDLCSIMYSLKGLEKVKTSLKISILEKMGAELPQTNTHTTYKEVVLDAKKIDFWNSKSLSINLDSLKNAYEQTYDFSKLFSDKTPQDAKRTYFQLSKIFHPDKNPNNLEMATFFFQKIKEAYEI